MEVQIQDVKHVEQEQFQEMEQEVAVDVDQENINHPKDNHHVKHVQLEQSPQEVQIQDAVNAIQEHIKGVLVSHRVQNVHQDIINHLKDKQVV